MQSISDEQMQHLLQQSKAYTLVLLQSLPNVQKENLQEILWEHGRRNFALRAEGLLSIVAPVTEESEIAGIAIFNCDAAKAKEIMLDDPAVKEGVFSFAVLPIRSFPGDSLPA